jgi:hypothetical protein
MGLRYEPQYASKRASSSSVKNRVRPLSSRYNRTCFTGFSLAFPHFMAMVEIFQERQLSVDCDFAPSFLFPEPFVLLDEEWGDVG